MDPFPQEFVVDQLTREVQLVRSIARAILKDDHLAEDVVQDTYLKLIEKRRDGPIVIQWLKRVARNLAIDRQRSDARRSRREIAVAQSELEVGRSTDAGQESGKAFHSITHAIATLDEPYKKTIVARYFEGLTAKQIAARDGVALATVSSRQQRALALLREKLALEYRDDPGAMRRGLILIAGPQGLFEILTSSWIVMSVATRALFLAAALAVATLCITLPILSGGPEDPGSSIAAASSTLDAQTGASESLPGPPPSDGTDVDRSKLSANGGSLDVLAVLRAHVVSPDGAPAAGLRVRLHGFDANEARAAQSPPVSNWQDLETTTNEAGDFEIQFDPPAAYQFVLAVEEKTADGGLANALAEYRWNWMHKDSPRDLGVVALPQTVAIHGRIVDSMGNPAVGPQTVHIEYLAPQRSDGRTSPARQIRVDPATGEFRDEHVAIGSARIYAERSDPMGISGEDSSGTRTTLTRAIEILQSEMAPLELPYVPAEATATAFQSHRIRVVLRNPGFERLGPLPQPAAGSLFVTSPSLPGPMTLLPPQGQVGRPRPQWTTDVLPSGAAYSIELNDPNFENRTTTGIALGQMVEIPLLGKSAIHLSVHDAATGVAVANYSAFLRYPGGPIDGRAIDLVGRGNSPPADGIFGKLFAGSYILRVEAPHLAPKEISIDALAVHETRSIEVALSRGAKIHGSVRVSKTAIPDVTVNLHSAVESGPTAYQRSMGDPALRVLTTAADGSFEFDALAAGPYRVEAVLNDEVRSPSKTVVLESEDQDVALALELPRTGSLRGTVRNPDGTRASLPGAIVVARSKAASAADPAGAQHLPVRREGSRPAKCELGADGSFFLPALPIGGENDFDIYLLLPPIATDEGIGSTEPDPLVLGAATIPSENEVEQDFTIPQLAPGVSSIDVRVDGAPAAECTALLYPFDPPSPGTDVVGSTRLDSAGTGTFIARHGVARLIVRNSTSTLIAVSHEPVDILAGSHTHRSIELTTIAGSIVVLDAGTRRPRIGASVSLRLGSESTGSAQTDATGRLDLRLSAGTYHVSIPGDLRDPNSSFRTDITWPPSSTDPIEILVD